MPKIGDMYPSKYLKADDAEDGDLLLTIKTVEQETVGQGDDAAFKFVVHFTETDKGLVLNKTNTMTIGAIHGADTDDWDGKRVALYATEVEFQGKTVLALRVRLKAPKGLTRPAPAPATPPSPVPTPARPAPAHARTLPPREQAGGNGDGDGDSDEDIPF